jgi:Tol biopolymer transport system component
LNGKISFWSNEGGTWSIYLFDLENKSLNQLTDTEDDFWYPASWSPDGRFLAFVTLDEGPAEIYLLDMLENTTIDLTDTPVWDSSPAWSPDGTKIAFHSSPNGNPDIYIMDINEGTSRNLTRHPSGDYDPTWSPNGKKIAFLSTREGGRNQLYVVDVDGSNMMRLTNFDSPYIYQPVWSPDGSKIAFDYQEDVLEDADLYLVDADGNNLMNLTDNDKLEGKVGSLFSWSPDGSRIAFNMDLGEYNNEIFVVNIVSKEITRLTYYPGGDFQPVWSLDGSMIAFVSTRDANEKIFHSIYVIDSNGEGEPIQIFTIDWVIGPIFWIP